MKGELEFVDRYGDDQMWQGTVFLRLVSLLRQPLKAGGTGTLARDVCLSFLSLSFFL
jgi:hypothetical protein